MANVLIGCKLPHGLQLQLADDESETVVVLNGQNQNGYSKDMYVPPVPYGETKVDADFWNAWKKENAGLDFVKKGLVFEAPVGKPAELAAKAKDTDKTGLEPLNQADIAKSGVQESK